MKWAKYLLIFLVDFALLPLRVHVMDKKLDLIISACPLCQEFKARQKDGKKTPPRTGGGKIFTFGHGSD